MPRGVILGQSLVVHHQGVELLINKKMMVGRFRIVGAACAWNCCAATLLVSLGLFAELQSLQGLTHHAERVEVRLAAECVEVRVGIRTLTTSEAPATVRVRASEAPATVRASCEAPAMMRIRASEAPATVRARLQQRCEQE
jgi:hypothetical protein